MGKAAILSVFAVGALLAGAGLFWAQKERKRQELARSIDLVANPLQPRGKVGQPIPLEFRLTNSGTEPAWVALGDAEGAASFSIQVFDDRGVDQRIHARMCGTRAWVQSSDLIEIGPGENSPVLRDRLKRGWWPKAPGRYTVLVRYRYRPADVDFRWVPFRELSDEVPAPLHPFIRRTFPFQRTLRVSVDVDP